MKSTLCKVVGLGSWLITALAAINVGLEAFGYDFFASDMMMDRFANMRIPLMYVVGVAGIVCLVMFIQTMTGHCHCGSSNCSSCSAQ
jgi:uncharacterized membrane protein YuzA (DUF378 family)